MTLNNTPAWQALTTHAASLRQCHLRELFAEDAQRFARFSRQHDGLLLDFSKQRIDADTHRLLLDLAAAADIDGWRQKMLDGEAINHTEGRAVRHVALRAGDNAPPEARAVLERLQVCCENIHNGTWRGYTGERITDIVNIGIGGSDLGPRMAVRALAAQQKPDLRVHFVANVDSADIAPLLARLNPRTTLFIIASKTFTTQETLINAATARAWLLAAAEDEAAVSRHFIAISTARERTRAFGIADDNVFEFWDWVGGRFSLWSAIGLSLALAVGWRQFEQLLAGARAMDEHFANAPASDNLPLTLALLSLWNTHFLGARSAAVLPYSQSLERLPAYLQQLEMESNGKQIDREGRPLTGIACPVVWGEPGTNGQHSFYQLLHQGGQLIPCDFIALRDSDFPLSGHHADHHRSLLANCLAQSAALAFGQTAEEVRAAGVAESLLPYRVFPGNQPSTTLLLPALNAYTLGQLLALYEHKTFCLGVLWNINSFDQWGVELGKTLARRIEPLIAGEGDDSAFDVSTRGLLAALNRR
ncbi:MAG: glucose-6-phosphate isomerase [Azonexus sp.]|jgi:glucose-6-phosphate isomerase|uniref:glucose-6-phosphate isomerase n=1 Tax=Azonexus sp. TaxID=1872668 RepID=UPI00281F8056|nr:glucose-6-phosphate isomerase [Azonexus sp.]MDR0776874.1 glucose-6-phosphate isomerase [Azonexus sp.]